MTDPAEPASEFQGDLDAVSQIPAVPTILDVVCRISGLGFATIARVTEARWIACSVRDDIGFGLQAGGELQVQTTLCHEVLQHHQPVIINDVAADPVFCSHPTPRRYGFQSYISMPILLPDGRFFGTLCAFDAQPRLLDTPEIIGAFRLFAELIAFHLDAHARLAQAQASLQREREAAELREQFIAVLGHDLRNPLAAVSAGVRLLLNRPERAPDLAVHIERSISRMTGLIDNLKDFARARLGGGLPLRRDARLPVRDTLLQVIQELQTVHPERRIVFVDTLLHPVACDRSRIGQLLSNLLGNALTYGAADQPVQVLAASDAAVFSLSVKNAGPPIAPGMIDNLFQPFFRGGPPECRQGLGLGLYIAREIAHAHGGTLEVCSQAGETCFTLTMPAA